MAVNRPTTKTIISTTGWGIPITDQVNANTNALAALTAGFAAKILAIRFDNGPNNNTGTGLGNRDKVTVAPGTFTVPTTIISIGFVSGGGPGTNYVFLPECYSQALGATTRTYGTYTAITPNMYTNATMVDSWNVPANGNTGYTLRVNLQTNAGAANFWLMGGSTTIVLAQ